jgi:UDP-N-acetylmuramyl pentapeptide phosphotransferase/UDP-N-acetylglucosamine-1-phosphate transferase
MDAYLHSPIIFMLALIPSVLLCRVVITLRIVDAPTEARKRQPLPVPTAGGLAVALSACLAAATHVELHGDGYAYPLIVLICGAAGMLALGLIDDIMMLRAIVKLALLVLVAAGMAAFGLRADVLEFWPGAAVELPFAIAMAGSILWLVVVTNAVNFMDGANGLAMGMACIAALGLAACGAVIGAEHITLASIALAGGLVGFLVWNVRGLLFVGDAGALFTGAVLAGLGLELVRLRPDLLFVPPILLMPFLSDVLLTLAWRAKHGKKLWVAHLDHTYQIALKTGLKHTQVAGVHAVWALNAAVVAVGAAMVGGYAPVIAFVVLLAISTWVHWKVRRAGVANGLVGADLL